MAINNGPSLPAGIKVSNPVRTWGGAEAETTGEGEKQIARYLQHRDRLVSSADFEWITKRTPGIDVGRVEVLPAYSPQLTAVQPGDAPGAVTLMLIPRYDESHPDTPEPDQNFLNAVCAYLDPRRLVTTELFLRGPSYKPVWISVGFKAASGASVAQVREDITKEIYAFLSPLPSTGGPGHAAGWPLSKPVVDRELLAVASRVRDVLFITRVLIAGKEDPVSSEIPMQGLELPRIAGLSVNAGDPIDIEQLRGTASGAGGDQDQDQDSGIVPVPVIPEECS
jgi:predicted phage baseplate assembly protein